MNDHLARAEEILTALGADNPRRVLPTGETVKLMQTELLAYATRAQTHVAAAALYLSIHDYLTSTE